MAELRLLIPFIHDFQLSQMNLATKFSSVVQDLSAKLTDWKMHSLEGVANHKRYQAPEAAQSCLLRFHSAQRGAGLHSFSSGAAAADRKPATP